METLQKRETNNRHLNKIHMEKNLKTCKDIIAEQNNFSSWKTIPKKHKTDELINSVAELYASQYREEVERLRKELKERN